MLNVPTIPRLKKQLFFVTTAIALFTAPFVSLANDTIFYHLSSLGIRPNTGKDVTEALNKVIYKLKQGKQSGKIISIVFEPGRYDFFPENAIKKTLFISNHDQVNPKVIGVGFENMENVVINGNGADWVFHGRMLPVAFEKVRNFIIKNVHIDFYQPQICQVEVLVNDTINKAITFKTAPWVTYQVRDSIFYNQGESWEFNPSSAIAFEKDSKHIVYNTSDVGAPLRHVAELAPGVIKVFNWNNKKLLPGHVLALRSWQRPAPGIFIDQSKNTTLQNVSVHYAEGMGLLAQVSEDITLNNFRVALRDEHDPRYFTTQADATHFSGCRGRITSINGFYEAMMDDAINVHGTYLKVTNVKGCKQVLAQYMHGQSYGFKWGEAADEVQFIASKSMETISQNKVRSIKAIDQPTFTGAKQFEITFEKDLDTFFLNGQPIGIENLSWAPEVYFAGNTIRNNRARGALFSTPKNVVVENNLFDHTSGSAILLCGDCNGWYETGACRSVLIKNNRFINALTSMFQFTNAIISIYPEIPELKKQQKYFHSGVKIEGNRFETFDKPILYAKSVDGLTFKNNTVITNQKYQAFHWNRFPFLFQRVVNYKIASNQFDYKFKKHKDIKSD